MNRLNNILWGLVFIVLGIIFGLNALDITNINIFFDGWWTLFIIIPCFIDLFKNEDKTANVIGLLIGIALLLGCQDFISFKLIWKLMFPAMLVIIGLSIIFKDQINHKAKKEIQKLTKNINTENEYCSTFGNQSLDFSDETFEGCTLNAVFGSVDCDLRNAKIKKDTVINISAIFGGVTILVPENAKLKIVSTPIFGGVSDKRSKKNKEAKEIIYINATCLFGGVDIK